MKVEKVPIVNAVGHILLHNQAGPDGRKAVKKGQLLTEQDILTLESLGKTEVYIATLAEDDVDENTAARSVGELMVSEHILLSSVTTGRANLIAGSPGLFKTKPDALLELNDNAGITFATVPNNSLVQPKKIIGTVKIIPYGLPRDRLTAATTIVKEHTPLVELKPFVVAQAVLITSGSMAAREKVVAGFTPVLRSRLAAYNTQLIEGPYVPEDEQEIGRALRAAIASGAEMILIAGETSIMDADDITPRAIKAIGAEIVHYGVPVEPGNLLLLAYYNQIPIVGAPGCAKSKDYNVVDMVLPRLAAGEHLTRRDLIELGHGGYLQ